MKETFINSLTCIPNYFIRSPYCQFFYLIHNDHYELNFIRRVYVSLLQDINSSYNKSNMKSISHATLTRKILRVKLVEKGIADKILIPEDGEFYQF